MSSPHGHEHRHADPDPTAEPGELPFRYPIDHLLAVIDDPAQLRAALAALGSEGFRDSEIGVGSGAEMADALGATSGRSGWTDLAIRFSDWLGLTNDEMAMKDRYEQALREGRFVVSVLAPTDEHKDTAARILRAHGAHFMNFLGRYTIVLMER